PQLIAGRRKTDAETLAAVCMAVAGQVGVTLCGLLVAAGLQPIGLHGASGLVLRARRRGPRRIVGGPPELVDVGLVGDVVSFDLDLLERLWAGGFVPVLACIGCDPASGEVLNINADVVATELAVALGADRLLLLTGAPGVLDRAD